MTQIYLIRHAEAEGNLYRRIHGWYNSLITPNGYSQIAALEERFRDIDIDAVYSSDLFRTMTTAGAIYKPKGLELKTDPGLREVNMGWWEDRAWGEVGRLDAEGLAQFNATSPKWKVEGGESLDEVRCRVASTLQKLAERHEGQTLAVFSHGCAIRNTLAYFDGLCVAESASLGHSDNTAVSLLEFDGDRVRVVFRDDNSHLNPEISTLARQKWWREGSGGTAADANLWYRPVCFAEEEEMYYHFRREAWMASHATMEGFHGTTFLDAARAHSAVDERAVLCAMQDEDVVGMLQMDFVRGAQEKIGWIPFYYMVPEARGKGLGIQLLGQAVSTYRPQGRNCLRLRCAPENEAARRFYSRNGFYKVGEEAGGLGHLDVLEKYIGYEEKE